MLTRRHGFRAGPTQGPITEPLQPGYAHPRQAGFRARITSINLPAAYDPDERQFMEL
jgi:ribosomal protein L34